MFILVLTYCTLFFFIIGKIQLKGTLSAILLWSFPFFLYFLVSGLQFNVGSDYPSYINIYMNQNYLLEKYFYSGEFFFYYIYKTLAYFDAPSQFIFVLFSFLQSIFIFSYFYSLKKLDFKIWLFFLIFFTVTNIYNNQLNGLRQYASLTLLPLISYFCFKNQTVKSVIFIIIAITFHSSSIIFLLIFPLKKLYLKLSNRIFLLFLITAPIYYWSTYYIPEMLILLGGKYSYYINSQYFQGYSLTTIYTKIYYIPLILYFFYKYRINNKNNINIGYGTNKKYFSFCIFIFSITYWAFLPSLSISILSRISSYFIFFYIFPIYYVIIESIYRRKNINTILILLYIILPYIIKVTLLAKGEFLYKSYIFN
ncbi:EpsG family protein [Xenorhabdus bovienii]|uniref:EpsG family protein n=1 Tax=Xenorhabdus bovienii TaxID=40576 RepID=UPI0034D40C7A